MVQKRKHPECTGTEKPVPKGFVPITLYHVTTNVDKVCREGFREPKDLWEEAHKKHIPVSKGIGGNTDDKISTTYNKELAEDYFKDIVTMSKIANGTVTPKNMCPYLNKHDKTPSMTKSPCEIWKTLDETDDNVTIGLGKGGLKRLEEGKLRSNKGTFDIIDEMSKEDAVKWELGDGDVKSRWDHFFKLPTEQRQAINDHFLFENADSDKIQDKLKDWWRYSYIPKRRDAGGRQNPVFFGVDLKTYQKDPAKIGIVQLKGYLPHSLDDYLDYIERNKYQYGNDSYDPNYGFPDERQYKDKFKILTGESEIRLNPEWYNQLKIIKKGK